MKISVHVPTPNFRWFGFFLRPDCCDGKMTFHIGLWWRDFMFYHPHKEA